MKKGTVQLRAFGPKGTRVMFLSPQFSRKKLLAEIVSLFADDGDTVGGKPPPSGRVPLSSTPPHLPPRLAAVVIPYLSVSLDRGAGNSASVKSLGSFRYLSSCYESVRDGAVTKGGPSYTDLSWVDFRDGVKNPNWRSMVKQGQNATTPMTASRFKASAFPASARIGWVTKSGAKGSDSWAGLPPIYSMPGKPNLGALAGAVDNGALGKLFDRLYNLEHNADIGETLGEYKQVLRMLGGPLQGLFDLRRTYEERVWDTLVDAQRRTGLSLSRLDGKHAQEVVTALGKLWLEFKFGLQPLWSDLHSLIKAVSSARDAVKHKVQASWKADIPTSVTTNVSYPMNYFTVKQTLTVTGKYTVKYMCGVNPEKVDVLGYLERIGLTPSRFVPTIYAVMPYSWMLDYFTGINNVINALCSDFDFVTWLCKVERTEVFHEYGFHPSRRTPYTNDEIVVSSYSSGVVRLSRTDVVRSVPTTIVPKPSFSVPESWKPWANIAALLASRKLTPPGLLRYVTSSQSNPFDKLY